MNTDERKAARERCEAATPGPWAAKCSGHDYPYIETANRQLGCGEDFAKMHDAEFIAHARTDLPAALDECDRLEGEVERLRDALGIVERATHVSDDFPDDANTHGKFGPMRRMAHDVAAAALEGGSNA